LGRLISALVKFGALAAILVVILLAAGVAISLALLPSFDELKRSPNGQTVQVLDAKGTPLITLGPGYGDWLPIASVPMAMRKAIVAVEDRRFYHHIGVDPVGVAAAAKDYVVAGRPRGASTITQQLARNLYLTNERTFARKLREAVLALALEQRFTKDQLLELYLNRVYFGGGSYGIDAASRRFFGHPATTLSLGESAIIAGLVKAPSHYAPTADPDAARARAETVLAVMADAGAIPRDEAGPGQLLAVKLAPDPKPNDVRYFTDWALQELNGLTDETVEPLVVTTTLDNRMQTAAAQAIATAPEGVQGALVAMTRDGAVKAMIGGKNYAQSNYNRAVSAVRQPGSAFKLFVYLAGLEDGIRPDDVYEDRPVSIGNWSPKNYNGRFVGPVTVTQAFAASINTVAVQIADRVGYDSVAAMAKRLGVSTPIDRQPAMALGSSDVRLIDMVRAYAAVANNGREVRPYGILKVESRGRTLYEHQADDARQVIAPDVAAQMTSLLKAAVETGTGRQAQMGRDLAGKTGTTSSNKDGYFVGFTSDLIAGVWMGRDDARPVRGLAGGAFPARAFARFMGAASRGTAASPLNTAVAMDSRFAEPDADAYGLGADPTQAPQIDPATGEPIVVPPPPPAPSDSSDAPVAASPPPASSQGRAQPRLDDQFIDRVLHDRASRPPPA